LSPDKQLIESALLVIRWQRGDREAFAEIVRLEYRLAELGDLLKRE
jgi:hypothetical protein